MGVSVAGVIVLGGQISSFAETENHARSRLMLSQIRVESGSHGVHLG